MPSEKLNFRSSHNNFISIEPTKIKANIGLEYPRLLIPTRFDLKPLKEGDTEKQYVLLDVSCSLILKDGNQKISDCLRILNPSKVFSSDFYREFDLEFPLDSNRIAKIEKERRGDLNLTLKINLFVGVYEQTYITEFDSPFATIDLEIPQSHWVDKILPELAYGEYFIVEIPKGKKIIEDAWSYVEAAESRFRIWDTKGAYANCREAGVLLEKTVSEKLGDKPEIKKWKRFLDKFNPAASLDLHLEDIKNQKPEGMVTVNKLEVEHLLIVTKALVKYAEGLLSQNIK